MKYFQDLNLYIQKTGNLEGADINIIDLEYNETTGIIEARKQNPYTAICRIY